MTARDWEPVGLLLDLDELGAIGIHNGKPVHEQLDLLNKIGTRVTGAVRIALWHDSGIPAIDRHVNELNDGILQQRV